MKVAKEIMKIIEDNLEFYYSVNETPNVFEFVLEMDDNDVVISSFFKSHGHEKMTHVNVKNRPDRYLSFSIEGEMDDDGKKLKDWDSRKDALEEKIECDLRCELDDGGFISCECGLRECFDCNSNNVLGDIHGPWLNQRRLDLVLDIAQDLDCSHIIINGDCWDDSKEKIADLISKKHVRENF